MRWSVVEPTWLPNPCQESQLVQKWEARRPSRRKSWLLGRKNPILITKKLNCNNHKTFSNNQSLKGDGQGTRNYLEADKPSSLVNSSDQTLTLDERTRNRPKWDKNGPKTISSIHFFAQLNRKFFWALSKQFWFGRNKTTLMSFFTTFPWCRDSECWTDILTIFRTSPNYCRHPWPRDCKI